MTTPHHPANETPRSVATISYIGNPRNPPPMAIISVAARYKKQTGQNLAGPPPVNGARQLPSDGLWYVQRGTKADGSPQYFRVDG